MIFVIAIIFAICFLWLVLHTVMTNETAGFVWDLGVALMQSKSDSVAVQKKPVEKTVKKPVQPEKPVEKPMLPELRLGNCNECAFFQRKKNERIIGHGMCSVHKEKTNMWNGCIRFVKKSIIVKGNETDKRE